MGVSGYTEDTFGNDVEKKFFRSMIKSLLYLTTSCLNIAFNMRSCARFQASPKESHLIVVKKIRYANDTIKNINQNIKQFNLKIHKKKKKSFEIMLSLLI